MKTNYLICYDIKDEKRLMKVHKYLKERCLKLQYSVFYGYLDWNELTRLKEELTELINDQEDDIRIYPLTTNPKVIVMGQGDRIPEGVTIFLK